MPVEHTIHLLDPKSIRIDRDVRQRKIFTTDDLEASIPKRGQLTPIIVRKDGDDIVLVAGERRLTTFLNMPSLGKIKATFLEELDPVEAKIVELEENIRRQQLSWSEECEALLAIHNHYLELHEGDKWNLAKTAEAIGYNYNQIFRMVEVAKELEAGGDWILQSSGWTTAYNALEIRRERAKENATAKLNNTIADVLEPTSSYEPEDVKAITAAAEVKAAVGEAPVEADDHPFLLADSIQWMKDYRGVPFNFAHCDFPYGIDIQDSEQANANEHGTYEDSPEVYWELLSTFLANRDKLLSPQAHIIFWFSPKYYVETREFFEKNSPDLWVQDVPLVWLKSDNRGIVADVQRRPRNITELAFFISRGDRKLLKAVANGYAAPTSRVIHQSEKPIPVLKHFFQMIVDENTRMFDPTSGSGNALVAADHYGANTILGVEKEATYFERSVQAWKKYRALKLASEINNG